jgi:hypothetical protein
LVHSRLQPFRALGALTVLTLAIACGDDSPTSPTPPFTTTSQFFVNTLAPGGTSSFNFDISAQSHVALTLASAISNATGLPTEGSVRLGLGTVSGATCNATTTIEARPALDAQLRTQLAPGSYCLTVLDGGGLGEAITFAARMTATSAEPPTTALNFAEAFSSAIPIGGFAERTFEAFQGGNSSVTLSSTGGDKVVRLSIGLWDGAVCRVQNYADVPAGSTPQLVAGLDAGTYCVRLQDINNTGRVTFSITISHP